MQIDHLPKQVRHKKRGTTYAVIGVAGLQSGSAQNEGAELVIYRGNDGRLWARPHGEFSDGRFEVVEETIEEEDDDFVTCEGCKKPIRAGDKYLPDWEGDIYLCESCAPTYEEMRNEPEAFRNGRDATEDRAGETMTSEEAEAYIATHLAGGGKITDKVVVVR